MKLFRQNLKFLLPLFIIGIFFVVVITPYYGDGKMISGGEGSYFLDFNTLFKNYAYSWTDRGTGIFAISLNFAYVFHLLFFQSIFTNERLVNFVMILLIYFLPCVVIYFLSLELGLKPKIAFLISFFYISNPFMANFLKYINQWNTLAAYILPSFFLIILKFYNQNLKLFFFFGFNSLLFAFTNANPPIMAIYQITIILFVIFISFYKEQKFKILPIAKNYLTAISSFFLFNLWWILNSIYIFFDAQRGYTKEFAISWLRGLDKFTPTLWNTINLTVLIGQPIDPQYDYFSKHYSYIYVPIILVIPVLILIIFLIRKKIERKYYALLGLMLITIGFLSKGVDNLFGGVYEFMVMNVPMFSIFKSASEKWGILFIFLLTLYLMVVFKEMKKDKIYPFILAVFMIYISYNIIPFISGNFIPDYRHSKQITGTRKFLDKVEYKDLKKEINSDPLQYRVLSLPGSLNYQVALRTNGGKFYTGNDPILNNVNKPFIAPYSETTADKFNPLFDSLSQPNYLNLLGLYNIRIIVINKDMYPWFGFGVKENISEIENILDKDLSSSKNQVIDIYDTGDYYLPRFYVPKRIIYSPESDQNDLSTIVSVGDFSKRSAIFIKTNSQEKKKNEADSNIISRMASETAVTSKIQSAVDEVRLRAGVEGMNQGGVLFPYVRWRPGSFLYFYVQQKEQKIKDRASNNPATSLEQHLFFAAKRISEIQRWGGELNDKQYMEVLDRYGEEMNKAITDLDAISLKEDSAFPTLVKIEVSFGAHEKRLMDVLNGYYPGEDNERIRKARAVLKDVDYQLKSIIEKYYLPIKYRFDAPENGEYEILAERSKVSSDWKITGFKGSDSFIASVSGEKNDANWVSFGKRQFDKGQQLLTFIQPSSQNLLNNKEWKKLENKVELGENVRIFGLNNYFGVYQDVKNWQPKTTYKFSLKYKGGPAQIILIENEEDVPDEILTGRVNDRVNDNVAANRNILINKSISKPEGESTWQILPATISSGGDAHSATLFIISRAFRLGKAADFEFKDANIEPIIEPKMMLRQLKAEVKMNAPKISYTKINPTKYLVNIENTADPYFLVFSESSHRGWKAYIAQAQSAKLKAQSDDGKTVASYFNGEIKERQARNIFLDWNTFETWNKKSLPEDKHITMNGYANSWYITPEDAAGRSSYQIIIEYWPQRLFYLGAFISALTLLITLLIGAIKIVKSGRSSK